MIVAPHVIAACFLILILILNMLLLLFLFYASESYSHMILAGHFLLQSEPRLQYIDIYIDISRPQFNVRRSTIININIRSFKVLYTSAHLDTIPSHPSPL